MCSVSSSGAAFVHKDYIIGQGKRRSLAVVGIRALGKIGGYGAQFSLGRAGTLARTDSKRVYMSIPRRNTVSCNRSSWSCSSTGVRFMGEKPRAGIPTCRSKKELLGESQYSGQPTAQYGSPVSSPHGDSGYLWQQGRSQAPE